MAKNTVPFTATGQQIVGQGTVVGVIVCSHTSGTLKLVDAPNSAVGRLLLDTWTLAAGPQVLTFPEPLDFYEGVHAVCGGTVNLELVWREDTSK